MSDDGENPKGAGEPAAPPSAGKPAPAFPVPAFPAPAHVGPAPAREPGPVPREPEPVAPQPVTPEPDPVALEPDPVALEPDPVALEPDPVALEPDPVALEPARAAPEDGPSALPVVDGALTRKVAILLAVTSLVMVLFHLQLGSRENANTGSRYATIESLVDYGTYNIDASHYVFTPDKVKARGHFVSSKPPLLPTYGAGVYYVLKKVTGYTLTDNEGVVVWTVSLFTGWLGHLVFLIYFYRLCRLLLVKQLALLGTMAAACFANLGVAYATAINNHSPGATLAVVGFYYAYRARSTGRVSCFAAAGLWLGILPAIDLSSAAVTAFTASYLATRDWRRTLLVYVPLTLPGIASQLLLAHHATGSWIPAYADTGLMQYAGSYFGGRRSGIDALFEPKPLYAFHVLLGHHGLFSMTPLFGFSMFEIGRRIFRRDRYVAECAVFAATVVVVCAFYIMRTHNYGGWCIGMRWLVPIMPWLLVAFGLWLDRTTLGPVKWTLVVLAFTVSAFNVQDGLTSPFQFSLWHNFLDGEPNRNRLGPKWNLGHPRPEARKAKAPARPKPKAP